MFSPLVRHYVLLLLAAGGVLFFRLGAAQLWDRDEPRNARCAQEMLERGDWVTPTFNGELRAHKPALLYWLMMSAYAVFGVNEFAARFWNALLSVGTVLATYNLGRRLFGPRAGFCAGIVLATCPLFDMAARAATPDAPLIFFATAGMLAYVLAVFPSGSPNRLEQPLTPGDWFPSSWKSRAALYALLGVAVLAKGPVGLVLPLAAIGLFGLVLHASPLPSNASWQSELARWGRALGPGSIVARMRDMGLPLGVALVLLIAGPWYLAVGMATEGRFLREFFGEHNLSRALESKEGHSGLGPIYYLGVILAGTFPWSVLAAPLALDAWRRVRSNAPGQRSLVFCLCWIAAYLLVFSLARTKLPSYVTPCYPALALVIGCFVDRWLRGELLVGPRWLTAALIALVLCGVGMTGGLAWAAHLYLPSALGFAALGMGITACGLAALAFANRARNAAAIGSLAAAAFTLAITVHGALIPCISELQTTPALMRTLAAELPQSQWVAVTGLEPSWVFYADRPFTEFVVDDENRKNVPWEAVNNLASADDPTLVFLLTSDASEVRAQLAPDVEIVAYEPILFRKRQILVLGPKRLHLGANRSNSLR